MRIFGLSFLVAVQLLQASVTAHAQGMPGNFLLERCEDKYARQDEVGGALCVMFILGLIEGESNAG